MTITGTLRPGESGWVVVEGQWGSGPWYRLASTPASNGAFRVRYPLLRPGTVHVRLALPDGDYAVRTIGVT
jgi:Na+-transporting NADH:ubiquinone oxidoreductase subunit NqrB